MGERKGTNKYYPPDFDPVKHGSLNGYHGTHALRERARKLSQGILIIRFEMPYNIWCDGCKNHIGMGVRYNAEKKKVGNYYTTPIYRFKMKCHLCVNYIEMQTDPATCDYVIVCGAARKEERWDMADNEQILTTERAEKEKLETDPMYKLDHGGKDQEKLRKALPSLAEIQDQQESWKDDFQLNSTLRRSFRTEKKVRADQEEKDDAVRKRTNLSIPLLAEKEEDKKLASLLTYQAPDSYDARQHSKRKEIATRSWFSPPGASAGSRGPGAFLHKLSLQGKGAAVAKALGPSPAISSGAGPLIRRRTAGPSSLTPPCTATARRKSDPGPANIRIRAEPQQEEEEEEEPSSESRQEVAVEQNTDSEGAPESSAERGQAGEREGDCGKSTGGLASLVADYSDSDSSSESL
ncbi:unnamed protein product [Arctogadus glacialis]